MRNPKFQECSTFSTNIWLEDLFEKSDMKMETWELKQQKVEMLHRKYMENNQKYRAHGAHQRNSEKISSTSEQYSMKMIKICKTLPKNARKFDEILLRY